MEAYGLVFGATVAEEMRNPKPSTAVWGKNLDAFRTRRAARNEERHKLDVALRGLRQRADRIARETAHLGAAGARAFRTATVVVDCRVDPAEQCFPMIPSGAAALDMIEYTDTLEAKAS